MCHLYIRGTLAVIKYQQNISFFLFAGKRLSDPMDVDAKTNSYTFTELCNCLQLPIVQVACTYMCIYRYTEIAGKHYSQLFIYLTN